jgi:hypothetical protein
MNGDFPLFRTLRLKWWFSVIALLFSIGALIYSDRTLRVTPAMAAGVTDRLWEVSDLVAYGPFAVEVGSAYGRVIARRKPPTMSAGEISITATRGCRPLALPQERKHR